MGGVEKRGFITMANAIFKVIIFLNVFFLLVEIKIAIGGLELMQALRSCMHFSNCSLLSVYLFPWLVHAGTVTFQSESPSMSPWDTWAYLISKKSRKYCFPWY